MVIYMVAIETSDTKGVMDCLASRWDHLAGHWDEDGLKLSAHPAYYESPEHLANSINSIFARSRVDAQATPWYNG